MERLIFILTTCFMLANCARIPDVDPLSYAASPKPSSPDVLTTAGSPSADGCNDVIFEIADCIPFLSDGNTNTNPEGSCCPGLEMVLKASDGCVCEAIESSADLGVHINMTKAMTLPSACGISAPSFLSECNLPLSPGASAQVPHTHAPKLSPKSQSLEPSQAPRSSVNVVPSPVAASHAGTYSVSASLVLTLSMLSASFYCISF